MSDLVKEIEKILGPAKYATREGRVIRKLAKKIEEIEKENREFRRIVLVPPGSYTPKTLPPMSDKAKSIMKRVKRRAKG